MTGVCVGGGGGGVDMLATHSCLATDGRSMFTGGALGQLRLWDIGCVDPPC